MKKAKIICTIGPASDTRKVVKKMVNAGMDCARINLSHGTFDEYQKRIRTLRSVCDIPIMLDTKGPEVRVVCGGDIPVKTNEKITFCFGKDPSPAFDHDFTDEAKKGHRLFIEDGTLKGKIVEITEDSVTVKFLNAGVIRNAKGVNLPDTHLALPILHKKDEEGLKLAKEYGLDFIALSFARCKEDIEHVRKKLDGSRIGLIAKIENQEGLDNFDEILTVVDGVMVARGDLGVELPSEKIPLIQKQIIHKCNQAGKFVITATQMLQTMIENPVPTRAETSDVANAILDGTDAIMLSAESAVGLYPVEAVKEMARISRSIEDSVELEIPLSKNPDTADAMSHAIFAFQKTMDIDKIVVLTKSGYTAKMISRFRHDEPIIAITPSPIVKRQLMLYFGVEPYVFKRMPKTDRVLHGALFAIKKGLVKEDDLVLFTAGLYNIGNPVTNLIEIHRIKDLVEFSKKL